MQAKSGPNANGRASGGDRPSDGVSAARAQIGRGYPAPVARLIQELAALPGIGPRSAERLALHLLKREKEVSLSLAGAIEAVKTQVRNCRVCSNLSGGELCEVCADPRRDAATVLVVEQPRDLLALEQTGMYKGVYHVLLGRLSPMDGIGPDALTVADLLARVRDPQRSPRATPVREVIMGLNPTLEGDGTALYLAQQLEGTGVTITRLARGLPTGSQLEFASKAVLADAISGRQGVG